jgi:DHA1 family multidrug resistance protein-like MFS transporter
MPFLALYLRQMGLTDTGEIALWTGITLGVTPAVTALCAPLWGRVGDRFGNKLLVQRSLFSCVIVMALMAFATEPWHLFALRALQGLVAGYGPLTLTMAAMSAPPDRMSRAIGTVQTAQRVAPAIGPVIGGVLAAAVGLRNAFLVSAAVYGIAFLLMAWLYIEPRQAARHGRAGERVTFTNILAFENFILLMVVIFGLQVVDRSFGPVLLLHLDQIGYGDAEAALTVGVLFSVLACSGAFGNQVTAAVLKRFSARVAIAGAVLLAAAALAAFAAGRSSWALTATLAVFGAAVGTAMTTAYTAAGSVIPRHAHGASFGLLSSASLVGSAVSPVLSGLVAGTSIRVVFVSGVVALALMAFVVRRVMVERDLEIESAPADEP